MQKRERELDETILEKVVDGNQQAYRILFDFYKDRVFSYAMRYLKDSYLAEEIVQDVFVKIWIKRGTLREVINFGGYLRRITVNATLDAFRKIAIEQKAISFEMSNWNEVDNQTEDSILLKDSQAYIDVLLEKLPKQQRLVYKMCHVQGLKQKDVAEALNISPLTVKAHLRDAVKALKLLIKDKKSLPVLGFVFLGFLK